MSYNFFPFLFVLMLLSTLICIQITSPGGTPIRGKNAEMCLQLSRHSISCLPCPFSSGVSHLQLLLSALTLPVLSLICTLPLVCLFQLGFSVISCRLIHCNFALLKGGYSVESLQKFGRCSQASTTGELTTLAAPGSLWTSHTVVTFWGLVSSGVLDGLLWCKCMEVTFSQENSPIHLCCCWWPWNCKWKEKILERFSKCDSRIRSTFVFLLFLF